jgi:MoaA/NifB/PqqE/SkfB family radical SAM enzyme
MAAASSPAISMQREAGFIPAVLDLSVTDYCNADCDFCGFARHKMKGRPRSFVDYDAYVRALPILKRRGIVYINFQGGEPLLHPRIVDMVRTARASGMKPSLITNGWKLPEKAEAVADAGIQNLLISIDSDDLDKHEQNRGLRDGRKRVIDGIAKLKAKGVPVMASVTVSKLVDFEKLPDTLAALGFEAVTFSYPSKDAFGSSSLVYEENSKLVDWQPDELVAALDAIIRMRKRFPVLNPAAGVRDIQRHLKGMPEHFTCVGGFKYFYMDWNLDIWRCETWHEPMGSVFGLDDYPDDRRPCTACIMSCYRDTSTMMHAGVAAAEAGKALRRGQIGKAAGAFFNGRVAESLGATIADARLIAKLRRRNAPVGPASPSSNTAQHRSRADPITCR